MCVHPWCCPRRLHAATPGELLRIRSAVQRDLSLMAVAARYGAREGPATHVVLLQDEHPDFPAPQVEPLDNMRDEMVLSLGGAWHVRLDPAKPHLLSDPDRPPRGGVVLLTDSAVWLRVARTRPSGRDELFDLDVTTGELRRANDSSESVGILDWAICLGPPAPDATEVLRRSASAGS